ncbi:MAG: GNVR domain-containing protein [Bacteroidota bacterium]
MLRWLRPIFKGWPVIVLFLLVGAVLGFTHIYYAIPEYKTSATLRINDKESGASSFLKNFESFSVVGQLLAEVEVLRSKYLVVKTINKLDLRTFTYVYHRGNPRNLYGKSPFTVNYQLSDSSLRDVMFEVDLGENDQLMLSYMWQGQEKIALGKLGQPIRLEGLQVQLNRVDTTAGKSPAPFDPGKYGFSINSMQMLLKKIGGHNLLVALPDEQVPIVKLFFTHEVPQLAADVVNTLAETYIEDFIENKTGSAAKALKFINEQIEEIEKNLRKSEGELAAFKARSKVVDLAMEADTKLKRISELELRKLTLELDQTELRNLLAFIRDDSSGQSITPNYESVEDPAFTNALISLSELRIKKEELLQKFTPLYPEVREVSAELAAQSDRLARSVENTLATNEAKIREMQANIRQVNLQFAKLPAVEKELMMLKRRFMTNEQLYSFLLERRAEASIGANSTISFHKILEEAFVPHTPIKPQKSLIMVVAALVGAMLGTLLVLLYHYLRATIYNVADIEFFLDIPVIGEIKRVPDDFQIVSQDFINLATHLHLIRPAKTISVVSYTRKEGKNLSALNLAKAMAAIGYKTLLIDLDMYEGSLHQDFNAGSLEGWGQVILGEMEAHQVTHESNFENLYFIPGGLAEAHIPTSLVLHPNVEAEMSKLQRKYDRIILNLPYLQEVKDAIPMMRQAKLNLISAWSDRTRFKHLQDIETLVRRFEIPDVFALLIKGEKQGNQMIYSMTEDRLPRIGQGARRKMLRNLVRLLLFNRSADGTTQVLPRIGEGQRRKLLWRSIKQLFKRK